jgi:tetratricopeptide (TPR) repeat protein
MFAMANNPELLPFQDWSIRQNINTQPKFAKIFLPNNEIRRIPIIWNYQQIKQLIQQYLEEGHRTRKQYIEYQDDGDWVRFDTQKEWEEAITLHVQRTNDTIPFKLRVIVTKKHAAENNSLIKITKTYSKEQYHQAIENYENALNLDGSNGEIWTALGHCFLMTDDVLKAYSAYHHAIYKSQNKTIVSILFSMFNILKDSHLWYGVGIMYEKFKSWDNAEEAFNRALKMDPEFEKSGDIYFRLGTVYSQQNKYQQSLECFGRILHNPPHPITKVDIWFQIANVYQLQKLVSNCVFLINITVCGSKEIL